MKIVLIVVGAAAGTLAVMFLAAGGNADEENRYVNKRR